MTRHSKWLGLMPEAMDLAQAEKAPLPISNLSILILMSSFLTFDGAILGRLARISTVYQWMMPLPTCGGMGKL
jgi:hypothetical protein